MVFCVQKRRHFYQDAIALSTLALILRDAEVLAQLAAIAPTTAVRGNNDKGAWADDVPATEFFEFGGIYVYAIHDLAELDVPDAPSLRVFQVVGVQGLRLKPPDRKAG